MTRKTPIVSRREVVAGIGGLAALAAARPVFAQAASGKPINVARVLHTLGRRPLASGFVGGETGKFIRRDLDEIGLAHDFVEVEPATRICVTVVDRSGRRARKRFAGFKSRWMIPTA